MESFKIYDAYEEINKNGAVVSLKDVEQLLIKYGSVEKIISAIEEDAEKALQYEPVCKNCGTPLSEEGMDYNLCLGCYTKELEN